MTAPTLITPRLTLRPPVMADFPAFAAMMASPRSRFMGGPYDLPDAWGAFSHDVACWQLFGHGALAVDRTDTGETVGQVGLNAGPRFPEPELGWMLYDGHEGQGYATEAARALRDWVLASLPMDSFVSYIDPANTASIGVAQRLGAVLDTAARGQDPEDLVFRHKRGAA